MINVFECIRLKNYVKNKLSNEEVVTVQRNKKHVLFAVIISREFDNDYISDGRLEMVSLESLRNNNICPSLTIQKKKDDEDGEYLQINSVYAGETRQGNGTILLSALKEYAKKHGYKYLIGRAVPDGTYIDTLEELLEFYNKNGFQIIQRGSSTYIKFDIS